MTFPAETSHCFLFSLFLCQPNLNATATKQKQNVLSHVSFLNLLHRYKMKGQKAIPDTFTIHRSVLNAMFRNQPFKREMGLRRVRHIKACTSKSPAPKWWNW